ncbi:MAG: Beta-xylosidase [Herbinix sp.]|jgi:xylan 1,4-beta-xylosidase|nr:Beta-xylosidase [Herbinix sp.]
MKTKLHYTIAKDSAAPFNNNATFCIGTGRMGLALQKAYHDQLALVQDDIRFSHIRGHGLFCDDMAIYQVYEEDGQQKVEYNFTYLDMVFDDYLSLGLKPFIELGFMPYKLASGDQTIFYWKGNVTPPSDYEKWANLIIATIAHWFERYGTEEVLTWPFEVWNEPNLRGFWKDADMAEYFKLYEVSAKAVKEADPRLRVGGPAICGVDDERWLREFLLHCQENKLPLDFVTRHAYATEMPDHNGHYSYQRLRTPQVFLDELKVSRQIIDSFPEYAGMEMHITEFNTSYTPLNPIHDTNLNAAYIARLLSEMGDTSASYSYWTFGDIFEEAGVAFTPFSGCFGLVANGMIRKPTYWAFSFYHKLGNHAIAREENFILTKEKDGSLQGIAWNPVEDASEDDELMVTINLPIDNGDYAVISQLVDETTCNPLKTWMNIGSPSNPSKEELKLLRSCDQPQIRTEKFSIDNQVLSLPLTLSRNALLYFKIQPIKPSLDRGYQPERVAGAL